VKGLRTTVARLFGRQPQSGWRNKATREKTLRARVLITGLVQGVYYRAHARHKAMRLGITGWIRNRPNGAVEAVFEGNEPAVRAMLQWCRLGSPGARVSDVAVTWEPPTGEFNRFAVREG
jgi:acylphosphatase